MTDFLAALAPVIAIVALGRFLGWQSVIAPEGWPAIERLAYVLLFPALIIRSLAEAPFESAPWKLAAVLVLAQLALGAAGLLARFWPGTSGPQTGTIIQSNVRWNTFVALSIGSALFGAEGLALVTIAAAAMIPAANILSVTALTAHAERLDGPRPNIARQLVTNPLLIACAIGIAIAASGRDLPVVVSDTLRLLGQGTIALGLLSAGAGVDLSALRRAGARTVFWSLVRLAGLPLLAVGFGLLLGLQGLALAIAVICASVPTATTSYVLARQLGGDGPLAANLIATQTLLAALTMPLIWWLCLHFGLV